jgi:hypothetical protein
MRNKLHLHIPIPCHEEWNDMKPVQEGRFCLSCQKSVVDFTNMSDTEIVNYFKKPSVGSVCGRFQEHQLNRDILKPRKSLPWIKYFFQFTLPAFLISVKGEAQQGKIKARSEISSKNTIGDTVFTTKPNRLSIPGEIKGRVIDEKGTPIQYSSIVIKEKNRTIVSDSSGSFIIKIKETDSLMTLIASSIGFEQSEKAIDVSNLEEENTVLIILKESSQLLKEVRVVSDNYLRGRLGGLVSSVRVTRWEGLKDTVCSFFTKFSVYPNPVISGASVTVENKILKEDIYSVQIINLTGQIMHNETVTITGKQRLSLKIPQLVAGTYFLKLTAKKSGKSFSEKIIVQ